VSVAHPLVYGLMTIGFGVLSLLIAGHELAVRRAVHISFLLHHEKILSRDRQPVGYWLWVLAHGLLGLAFVGFGVVTVLK
jgi:hypothetical protein